MNKNVKIGLIVLSLLIIIFLIYKFYKPTENYFKPVVLDYNNSVFIYNDKKYLDTIIKVGLKNLDIKDVMVIVYPLTSELKNIFGSDTELKAHIRENAGFQYFIWIDDISRNESIKVLSHELIHLKQYNTSELTFHNDTLKWKGKIYDLNQYQYNDRPWEIDAFSKENELRDKITKELY